MFSNPIWKGITMSQLFSIKGRLGRSNYQNHYLISLGFCIFSMLVYEGRDFFQLGDSALLISLAGLGFALLSMTTAAIRRLHDLDRPAWHLILTLVPVYNVYLVMSLLCLKGEEEVNLYGYRPEPL